MFNMNNKVYDYIKWGVIILLPAIAVLYGTLSKLYGLPCVEQVQGTIGAIQVFLGTILCISSAEYKGKEAVDKAIASIELKKDTLDTKKDTLDTNLDTTCPIEEKKAEEIKAEEVATDIPCPMQEIPPQDNGTFKINTVYKIICSLGLRVREGAGTQYRAKGFDELTPDGQKHASPQGTLLQGTLVSAIECIGNWIRIPSGWICGKDDEDGTLYIEEYTEAAQVQAIRNQLAQYTDPLNQGFYNMCEGFVHTVYANAGVNYTHSIHPEYGGYCCANAHRDTDAQSGNPENGDIIFSGGNFHNFPCSNCGRECGHTAIYMDGMVYGSQNPYIMSFGDWCSVFDYGGHTHHQKW